MVLGIHSRRHSRNVSTATAHPPEQVTEHFQFIFYLRRKPGMSKEQFYDHWEHVHAKKVAPWAERVGVVSYRQVCGAARSENSMESFLIPCTDAYLGHGHSQRPLLGM